MSDRYVSFAQVGQCQVCDRHRDLRMGSCWDCSDHVDGAEVSPGVHKLWSKTDPSRSWFVSDNVQ